MTDDWASMMTYVLRAALLTTVSVALAGMSGVDMRLRAVDGAGIPPVRHDRLGVDGVIAAVRAQVQAGGTLVEAYEHVNGCPFAVPRVTVDRLRRVLAAHRIRAETDDQIDRAAKALNAIGIVSASLGCPAARCLDVVADDYRRMRLLQDLKHNALAVPQATVRLLSALPAVTVVLGELLGASPVAYLFGTETGMLCLAFGLLCYAAGLWWLRVLFDSVQAGNASDGDTRAAASQ